MLTTPGQVRALQRQPALHDLITAAIPTLEQLKRASARGQPLGEVTTGGELLELVCVLGPLTGSEGLCRVIAKHPGAPSAVLTLLAESDSEQVRSAVASHSGTPPEALRALAESDSTRQAVAGNPSAPPEVLVELAGHWDEEVRTRVAHNPGTPEEIRRMLIGPAVPTEIYLP